MTSSGRVSRRRLPCIAREAAGEDGWGGYSTFRVWHTLSRYEPGRTREGAWVVTLSAMCHTWPAEWGSMDPLTDLFTAKPLLRDGDGGWWVSKTDVTSYQRCPWAFWLVDSGQLASAAILEVTAVRRFIEEGIAFESAVRSTAEVIAAGEFPTIAHHGEKIMLGTPVVQNPDLGLLGAPDGVWAAGGVMAPVEVKSHRTKKRLDEIELCFYWELLAPWRTLHINPVGLLVLPDGLGGFKVVAVELTDERFAQMRELVEGVRLARREPPRARICSCLVCSKIETRRVFEECRARGDLTLLSGLGPRCDNRGRCPWRDGVTG